MKIFNLVLILFILIVVNANAQYSVDLEDFGLVPNDHLDNAGDGVFDTDGLHLNNSYFPDYGSWAGWAISSETDNTTPGWVNQFSSIAGGGYDGSLHYAVSYTFGSNVIKRSEATEGMFFASMQISNNAYSYYSMKNGDDFAKKFGGEDGNDDDFFLLTIKGLKNGTILQDSINFYLADYRFENNDEDYIHSEWVEVDLSKLGHADSLYFDLSSTDNSAFGMNTPAYFCMDQVEFSPSVNIDSVLKSEINFVCYPNPAVDFVLIKSNQPKIQIYQLFNVQGILLEEGNFLGTHQIDISHLPSGSYLLNVGNTGGSSQKWINKD